jgi:hypothetical protein
MIKDFYELKHKHLFDDVIWDNDGKLLKGSIRKGSDKSFSCEFYEDGDYENKIKKTFRSLKVFENGILRFPTFKERLTELTKILEDRGGEHVDTLARCYLEDLLQAGLREGLLKFNYRGHHASGEDEKYYGDIWSRSLPETIIKRTYMEVSAEDFEYLLKVMSDVVDGKKRTKLRYVKLDRFDDGAEPSCSHCEEKPFLEFNGKTFRLSEKCPRPDGIKIVETELDLRSGKVVVANDLRGYFDDENVETDFYVNEKIGILRTTEAYASLGMAHAFVGNTCPGVYRINDKKFTVSNGIYDWEDEDKNVKPEGEQVASICTDLWWYSICDYNVFKDKVKKAGGILKDALDNNDCEVFNVKPGIYKVTHDFEARYKDDENTDIADYGTFEWVKE